MFNEDGSSVTSDIEKTFDSVRNKVLITILRRYNTIFAIFYNAIF